jgi:hypothetical protein
MAKEAVANARAAIAAVVIFLIFVMDVSLGEAERGSLCDVSTPRGAGCDCDVIRITQPAGSPQLV